MNVTPLEISAAALALSVVSLTWQGWTWLRSGPIIRVSTNHLYVPPQMDHYVSVTATNKGRSAATIDSWGIEVPRLGTLVNPTPFPWDAPLPCRLEPHASAGFSIQGDEVDQVVARNQLSYKDLRPFVQVGDRKVRARRLGGYDQKDES